MTAFIARPPRLLCAMHLAVLGTGGGGLTSSAREWLLQRLAAAIAQRDIATVALCRCVLRPWHLVSLGTLVKHQAAWANGVADLGATGTRRALLKFRGPVSQSSPLCQSPPFSTFGITSGA